MMGCMMSCVIAICMCSSSCTGQRKISNHDTQIIEDITLNIEPLSGIPTAIDRLRMDLPKFANSNNQSRECPLVLMYPGKLANNDSGHPSNLFAQPIRITLHRSTRMHTTDSSTSVPITTSTSRPSIWKRSIHAIISISIAFLVFLGLRLYLLRKKLL